MPLSTAKLTGPWTADQISAYLDEARIPLRLSAVAPSGWPVVLSLWFARRGDELVCATQLSASIVQALQAEPRCAFEVAGETPPYHGVRGRARVSLRISANKAFLLHSRLRMFLFRVHRRNASSIRFVGARGGNGP